MGDYQYQLPGHDEAKTVRLLPDQEQGYRVIVDEREYRVTGARLVQGRLALTIDGVQQVVPVARTGQTVFVALAGQTYQLEKTDGRRRRRPTEAGGASTISASMPGTIQAVFVSAGEAVEKGQLFHLHYRDPNQDCPIGRNIQAVLGGVFSKAETAMRDVLSQTTLAQIAQDIMEQSGISEKLASGFTVEELQRDFVFEAGKFIPRTES